MNLVVEEKDTGVYRVAGKPDYICGLKINAEAGGRATFVIKNRLRVERE